MNIASSRGCVKNKWSVWCQQPLMLQLLSSCLVWAAARVKETGREEKREGILFFSFYYDLFLLFFWAALVQSLPWPAADWTVLPVCCISYPPAKSSSSHCLGSKQRQANMDHKLLLAPLALSGCCDCCWCFWDTDFSVCAPEAGRGAEMPPAVAYRGWHQLKAEKLSVEEYPGRQWTDCTPLWGSVCTASLSTLDPKHL